VTPPQQSHPVSLRISVTDKCGQRCFYCMPAEGVPKVSHADILSFEEMVRFVRVVKSGFALSKVRVTGGEPLVRRDVARLIALLAEEKIADIALTTNAQRLAAMAAELKRAGLHRVNVSLDSLNPDTYRAITRCGDLQPCLDGIKAALEVGLAPVKLNTVLLRGYNDCEVTNLVRYAFRHDCGIRFIELMPIGCASSIFEERFVPAAEARKRLEECFEFEPLAYERGTSSRNFLATGGDGLRGVVGFISPETAPFCDGCRRLRLTSRGCLISCLADRDGPNIRHLLHSDSPDTKQQLLAIVAEALATKHTYVGHRRDHTNASAAQTDTDRLMFKIGGS